MDLYDRDFFAWANEQASLARARSGNTLDWDNVAEELESLGKQQRSELRSRYGVLILHLLKWIYQPRYRSASWEKTIKVQRNDLAVQFADSPSLKSTDRDEFDRAYVNARLEAGVETRLGEAAFPIEPPFTPEQARDPEFWPEPAGDGR